MAKIAKVGLQDLQKVIASELPKINYSSYLKKADAILESALSEQEMINVGRKFARLEAEFEAIKAQVLQAPETLAAIALLQGKTDKIMYSGDFGLDHEYVRQMDELAQKMVAAGVAKATKKIVVELDNMKNAPDFQECQAAYLSSRNTNRK